MELEYAGPARLSLSGDDLPDQSWPRPRAPRWPCSGDLSDYLRVRSMIAPVSFCCF